MFLEKFCCKFLAFSSFSHKKRWKWLFGPAFGVRSTQTLVEKYNTLCLHGLTINIATVQKFFFSLFIWRHNCILDMKTDYFKKLNSENKNTHPRIMNPDKIIPLFPGNHESCQWSRVDGQENDSKQCPYGCHKTGSERTGAVGIYWNLVKMVKIGEKCWCILGKTL